MSEAPVPVDTESSDDPKPRRRGYAAMAPGIALAATGMLVLALAAQLERMALADQPWTEAFFAWGEEAPSSPEGAIPIRARTLSAEENPPADPFLKALRDLADGDAAIATFRLDTMEPVIAIEMEANELGPLLASGRLPAPGAPEVLAGDLARFDRFVLDGIPFEVVGRLKRSVSGTVGAYLMPLHPATDDLFSPESGGVSGWAHPDGLQFVPDLDLNKNDEKEEQQSQTDNKRRYAGGIYRTSDAIVWVIIFALALMAAGGASAHIALFRVWAKHPNSGLKTLYREFSKRPRLFVRLHVALYALFLLSTAAGTATPWYTLRISEYVSAEFAQGNLGYIGDAYMSGDVLRAAAATFHNNFVVQTLGFTFLPWMLFAAGALLSGNTLLFVLLSLASPVGMMLPIGVVKTAASFGFVGFAMAPLWVTTAERFVFHGVTMVLELEAYIVACFVVIAWPLHVLSARSAQTGPPRRAFLLLIQGMVLTGGMLAFAAFYEAATIIFFHGLGQE